MFPFHLVKYDIVMNCANSMAGKELSEILVNVGDGSCDEFLNTEFCKFDGGDCSVI